MWSVSSSYSPAATSRRLDYETAGGVAVSSRWRRGAASARLFLPNVHCGTVTGAKMADNREEISKLVEKRGICRRVAPLYSPRPARAATARRH